MDPESGDGAAQMVARSADVLHNILLYLDPRSLAICLRTSKLLFQLAGPRIYRRLDLGLTTMEETLEGCASASTSSSMAASHGPSSSHWAYGKRALLEHCKVLTVEIHESSQCGLFEHCADTLFPNLEVLRIIPGESDSTLCLQEGPCDFVKRLDPIKVVFRNLRAEGLPIVPFGDWRPTRLRSVAYYIFRGMQSLHDFNDVPSVLPYDMLECFVDVPRVRIVFAPWEYGRYQGPCNNPKTCQVCPDCQDPGGNPMYVGPVTEAIRVMCSRSSCEYEIYGLEKLWLEKNDNDDTWEWLPGSESCVDDIKKALSEGTYADEDGAEKAFDANIAFYTWDQWEVAEKYGEVDAQTEETLRMRHAMQEEELGHDEGVGSGEESNDDAVAQNAPQSVSQNRDILLVILSHLDSPSLATCLRTSKLLFELVAPRIYRRITLDAGLFEAVLEGSLVAPVGPSIGDPSSRWAYGKRALLEHCRILTVEAHDTAVCEAFHHCAADLFQNLEVLRIVSCWKNQSAHSLICHPKSACPFVKQINPTKFVFQNLVADGLPVNPLSDWRPSRLDTAAYYIFDRVQTLHDRKRSTILPYDILYCFPGISRVRIVFSPWEINSVDEHEEPCNNYDDCAYCNEFAGEPMFVDKVIEAFRVMCGRAKCQYEVCGLDRASLEVDEDCDQWMFDCCGGTLDHRVKEALGRLTRVNGDGVETSFDGNITFYSWDQWLQADKYGELHELEEAWLRLDDGS